MSEKHVIWVQILVSAQRGVSSPVECLLAKEKVTGPIPVRRSNIIFCICAHYFGLLRIRVRKSTDLNRKISGWIEEICRKWGVV